MNRLAPEDYARARNFLETQARPLERARYAYSFESAPATVVLTELERFQNPDGGFGHALEPDLRLADSSVLATTVALQILCELQTPASHPMVQGAMRYLLATYNADSQVWPIIPPNTDDAAHAPWWAYTEDIAASWGGFLVNPRAEILGYLYDYADLVPAGLKERLTDAVLDHIQVQTEIPMFDFLCYTRLAETPTLPQAAQEALWQALLTAADSAVVRDPAEWEKYALTPLELVETPASRYMEVLAPDVERQLDFEIAHQGEDGAWAPKWSWYGLYPEVWPIARRDWQGVLTLRMLRTLHAFGRLT